jgi:hypothetical protein
MAAFADMIGKWAAETEARTQAVYRRSVELLAEEMSKSKREGGRVPYKDGNLARSLLASTQAMPKTATGPFSGSNVGVVIATLKLNQPIWLGYQAIYARRQNYGFVGADVLGRVFNQAGSHFLEGAIDAWPQIVAQAAKEIQGTVEGRQ